MPQQLPHSPKLISPLCYGNTGVFSSEGTAKNSLSLARLQTRSLKHTPSGILLPACTSVCKHIPLAADPRPSCCHSNQSPSPWLRLPPSHGSTQARDLQVTSSSFFSLFLTLSLLWILFDCCSRSTCLKPVHPFSLRSSSERELKFCHDLLTLLSF